MAEIKKLNYGTVPNDHSGDGLFYIFQDIDDNCQLLKNLIGPCVGTKYLDVRIAVKGLALRDRDLYPFYYISRIVCGVPESGKYRYTIEISKTQDISSGGSVKFSGTKLATAKKTGIEAVPVITTGMVGSDTAIMVIDWSLLTDNTTYTMDLPIEGYLNAFTILPDGVTPVITPLPDPWDPPLKGITVDPHTSDFTADGSYDLYQSTGDADMTLDSWSNIKGTVKYRNLDSAAHTVTVSSGSEDIDGNAQIVVEAGGYVEIAPTSTTDSFTVINGNYTLPV